jgi:hypothetical protein
MTPAAPAPSNRGSGSSRPTFYEVALEGQPEQVRGILTGLVLGSGVKGRLYFSHEEGVTPVSLGERLRDLVGLQAVCHVIVDKPVLDLLRRFEKRLVKAGEMRLAETKRIRRGRFDFAYHAYARQYGRQIRELFRSLPAGVKLEGGEPRETVDESARGIEAYSPTHHYEVEGEGTAIGRVDLLIQARRLLDDHPLVSVEPIHLEFA